MSYYQFTNCLTQGSFNAELHDLRLRKVTVELFDCQGCFAAWWPPLMRVRLIYAFRIRILIPFFLMHSTWGVMECVCIAGAPYPRVALDIQAASTPTPSGGRHLDLGAYSSSGNLQILLEGMPPPLGFANPFGGDAPSTGICKSIWRGCPLHWDLQIPK